MEIFLKLKHWYLFILIGLTGAWKLPSPLYEIMHLIGFTILFSWLYAVVAYGQQIIKDKGLPTISPKLFKLRMLTFPLLITFLMFVDPADTETLKIVSLIKMPIFIYVIVTLIQAIIYTCKTISTLELNRQVEFKDYFLYVLLFCFLIVGIWFLQPKINRLIGDKITSVNTNA